MSPNVSTGPSGSTSPSPAVRPPSGRKVDLKALTARTPEGFDYDDSLAEEIVFSASRDYRTEVTYSDITVFPGTSNRFAARLSIRNSDWKPKPNLAPSVTFAGARWYHPHRPDREGPAPRGVRHGHAGLIPAGQALVRDERSGRCSEEAGRVGAGDGPDEVADLRSSTATAASRAIPHTTAAAPQAVPRLPSRSGQTRERAPNQMALHAEVHAGSQHPRPGRRTAYAVRSATSTTAIANAACKG